MGKGTLRIFENHPKIAEIVRFLLVGGICTLLEYAVAGTLLFALEKGKYGSFLSVFIKKTNPSTAVSTVCTSVGYIVSTLLSYFLSVRFVFDEKGRSKTALGFTAFVLLSVGGLLLNELGMWLLLEKGNVWFWFAKILMTVIVFAYNYCTKKCLIFKGKGEKKDEEDQRSRSVL